MNIKYYEGTSLIINLSSEIGRLLGIVDATYLRKPMTKLRKANKIKSIYSSLTIEGNTLTIDQVTDILDNRRVIGPAAEILEVKNAIKAYEQIDDLEAYNIDSYLSAHGILMKGLVNQAGHFRSGNVGVFKGDQVAHMAPPAWNVHNLMNELFNYLQNSEDNPIIKSCVFHYEMEFIHPFADGNGRMGRLWQTVILMKANPVFAYIPIETGILKNQQAYYDALAQSDKDGHCTVFIEFILSQIKDSLSELVTSQRVTLSDTDRIYYFLENTELQSFTRKDYLHMFKDISIATATRDMKKGVEEGLWKKEGDGRTSRYVIELDF